MSGRSRHLFRVRVTDNGGDEPRALVPEDWDQEPETGAWTEVLFWPPNIGTTRHYQTPQAAQNKVSRLAENGVTAVIEVSNPITWPTPLAEADAEVLTKIISATQGVNIERDENGYPTEWGDL